MIGSIIAADGTVLALASSAPAISRLRQATGQSEKILHHLQMRHERMQVPLNRHLAAFGESKEIMPARRRHRLPEARPSQRRATHRKAERTHQLRPAQEIEPHAALYGHEKRDFPDADQAGGAEFPAPAAEIFI